MKRKMQNGIDVYTGQGVIDWRKVADSGISFAMIKASQGRGETRATKNLRSFTDSRFAYNIAEASKAGLMVGVWHWLTAQSVAEAIEEADYFLKVIAPHRSKITLWAAADVESETYLADIGKPELTQITRAFLNRLSKNGYRPMLYTNPNFIKYRFTKNAFADTDIWLAHYGVKKPMQVPNLKIWQHSAGRVDGIKTAVDLDTGYFDQPVKAYAPGDKYTIQPGDRYTNGKPVPSAYWGQTYTVWQVKPGAVLLKEIFSWVEVCDT